MANVQGGLSLAGGFKYHHWAARLLGLIVTPQAENKAAADFATLKRLAEM